MKGKKIAILTAHEFEDIEVMYTLLQLSQAGAAVVVGTLPQMALGHFHGRPAWPQKPITGRFGHTIPFDVLGEGNRYTVESIWEMDAELFDAGGLPWRPGARLFAHRRQDPGVRRGHPQGGKGCGRDTVTDRRC